MSLRKADDDSFANCEFTNSFFPSKRPNTLNTFDYIVLQRNRLLIAVCSVRQDVNGLYCVGGKMRTSPVII